MMKSLPWSQKETPKEQTEEEMKLGGGSKNKRKKGHFLWKVM
jgi:hypothetical protein